MDSGFAHRRRGWSIAIALYAIVSLLMIVACSSDVSVDVDDTRGLDGSTGPSELDGEVPGVANLVDPERETSLIVYWESKDARSATDAVNEAGGRVVTVVYQLGYLVAAFEDQSEQAIGVVTTQLESKGLRVVRDIVSPNPTTE